MPEVNHRVVRVWIQPAAPAKPAVGQACNGCGLCCLYQPCPVGMVVSRSRHGPCRALVWVDQESLYRCGLLQKFEPSGVGHPEKADPTRPLQRLLHRVVRRWIAAGHGCDADLQPGDPASDQPPSTR